MINAKKSRKRFGIVKGEQRQYGLCDFESAEVIEPSPSIRGDLARIGLYMHKICGVPLNRRDIEMYLDWYKVDPPDEWERDQHIQKIQGNSNPFVSVPDFAD